MSTAETEKLPPVTKAWHEAFGGRPTVVAHESHAIPISLSILFRQLYVVRSVVYAPNGAKILPQKLAGMQVLFLLGLLLFIAVYGQSFAVEAQLYSLTLEYGIAANAFRMAFVIAPSFFLTLGLLIETASLFWRYVFLAVRYRRSNMTSENQMVSFNP